MRRDWDRRALENARHYVATGQDGMDRRGVLRSPANRNFATTSSTILTNICQGKDPKSMRVLEIGCGAGRVTRALAEFFGEVYAVDISRHMVRQARQAVAAFPNAHIFRNNGRDLPWCAPHWWHG